MDPNVFAREKQMEMVNLLKGLLVEVETLKKHVLETKEEVRSLKKQKAS